MLNPEAYLTRTSEIVAALGQVNQALAGAQHFTFTDLDEVESFTQAHMSQSAAIYQVVGPDHSRSRNIGQEDFQQAVNQVVAGACYAGGFDSI